MKKMKAVAEGFDTCNGIGFRPFWRHEKVGVANNQGDVVLEPKFSYLKILKFRSHSIYFIVQEDNKYQIYSGITTLSNFELADKNEYDFIEAVVVNEELYFKTTMASGCGLYQVAGIAGLDMLVPNEYAKVEVTDGDPKFFKAYPSLELDHFDLYGRDYFEAGILLAKDVREYTWEKGYVNVTFADGENALYGQGFKCLIEKGKHQIQPENGFIRVIGDGSVAIHTWMGHKVSEDDSGQWKRFGELLVHIIDKERTFYYSEGDKLDLSQFEDVREESEFVFVKSNGHWRLLWTV